MFVDQVHCGTFWGDAFLTVVSKRQFTMFQGIGLDFPIQRKKSKLLFTDALNLCNKCIRVQRDMHRAVRRIYL